METLKPVILCGGDSGRCVVFGWVAKAPEPGQPVEIQRARMVLYWPAECNGLFGVAADGAKPGLRLTPAVDLAVMTVWREYLAVPAAAAASLDNFA